VAGGSKVPEITPAHVEVIPARARKSQAVREAIQDRRWITDIQGDLSPLAMCNTLCAGGSSTMCTSWGALCPLVALDAGQPVFFQVLLQVTFSRTSLIKLLEAQPEVLGTTWGEVLPMACLPR
jgi:hypothetical protein